MNQQRNRFILFVVVIGGLLMGMACCAATAIFLFPMVREKINEWQVINIISTTPTLDWLTIPTYTVRAIAPTQAPQMPATATATAYQNIFPFISSQKRTPTPTATQTFIPTEALEPLSPVMATPTRRNLVPTTPVTSTSQPGLTPTQELIQAILSAQVIEEQPTDYFQIRLRYPQTSLQPGQPGASINQLILALVEDERVKGNQLAWDTLQDEMQGYWWMDYWVISYLDLAGGSENIYYFTQGNFLATPQPVLKLDEAVFRAGHDLLGILFEVQSYAGSSHPGVRHVAVNYDLSESHKLALGDLFIPGADYLAELSSACIDALVAQGGEFDLNGATPKPEHFQVWNVASKGLLITFEEYQLGSAVINPIQIIVPYARLAHILKPNGPLGSLARE